MIAQNVELAQQESSYFMQKAQQEAVADPSGASAATLYDGFMAAWLVQQFGLGGPWDYKAQQSLWPSNVGTNNLMTFGNFNFGAVLESLGASYYFTQNAAGIYQMLKSAITPRGFLWYCGRTATQQRMRMSYSKVSITRPMFRSVATNESFWSRIQRWQALHFVGAIGTDSLRPNGLLLFPLWGYIGVQVS